MHKRRHWAKMVALTIAMLVSHDTTTKGGGLPWFTFSIYALPFKKWSQTWGASMHWERNKYDCFNNLIEMIVEICEIALLTRATPGSSLVLNKKLQHWGTVRQDSEQVLTETGFDRDRPIDRATAEPLPLVPIYFLWMRLERFKTATEIRGEDRKRPKIYHHLTIYYLVQKRQYNA